jgi:hypothetical protein
MCYSPEISTLTGANLLLAGVYCTTKAVKNNHRYIPLSFIPGAFGIQQLCEGLVWLGIHENNPNLSLAGAFGFLFFALFFWLLWIPLSIALIEKRKALKRAFAVMAMLGLIFGLMLYLPVVDPAEGQLTTTVARHSIQYHFNYLPLISTLPATAWHIFYATIVLVPLIASTSKELKAFGVCTTVAGIISYTVSYYAFISIWCISAAVMSLMLCVFFHRLKKE